MARPLRLLQLGLVMLATSGCATLWGDEDGSIALLENEVQAAERRAAELKIEVDQLKEKNADLTEKVTALTQQTEKLSAVAAGSGEIQVTQEEVTLAGVTLRENTGEAVRDGDRDVSGANVMEEASAPELEAVPAPVASAPRMVQPTFASTDSVFENEAGDDIQTASVLYGVHLASYRGSEQARDGWRMLQRENPDELGLLEPRVESVSLPDKGDFLRLIGGGFSSHEKASALCAQLRRKELFCTVSDFNGQRLAQ